MNENKFEENIREMIDPGEGSDMSTKEGRLFKKEPAINVISKDEFEVRVEKVFHLLWKTLSKSFGPYGAPTLICSYPYRHMTKDGYTIMKHLSFDASETKVDQAIADMAGDICGRLNYSVGDGTTSAIIATNSIYQNYRQMKEELDAKFILPRDIIKKYEKIKERVIEKLQEKAVEIRTDDRDKLYSNIFDVVYVSSNGDETITKYISELYRQLGAPAISCVKAPDGVTRAKLIEGYKYELSLADRLYINSDEKTMELRDADVIIFSTKITESTYTKILKPLNFECATRGRHLIVCAPTYDEMALSNVIAPELNAEYRKKHDVNMVLTRYRAISAHTRRLINDFSILMNTDIIDRTKERDIIDKLATGVPITQLISIDTRCIEGTKCIAVAKDQQSPMGTYIYGVDELSDDYQPLSDYITLDENALHLGFVKGCSLGLTTSQFTEMIFDENRYNVALKEAEDLLEEAEKKYQKLGTFNVEVSQCQERLYALKLKMGVIEVGADSEMSQAMLKDAVDDAVKAAESAYKHGTVLGCNVNLIQSIEEVLNETEDPDDKILIIILLNGFRDVYKTVLGNAFKDVSIERDTYKRDANLQKYVDHHIPGGYHAVFENLDAVKEVVGDYANLGEEFSFHDVLIDYSTKVSKVFDVSTFRYTNEVINSFQTDAEILTATIDLISLLIIGNQMVVTGKHNFE